MTHGKVSTDKNPWHEGSPYSKGDKSDDYHRCWGKILQILEYTGVQLDHESITWLCEDAWGCRSSDQFYRKMHSMSREELKEWAEKARKHKKIVDLINSVEMQLVYT